MIFFVTFHKVIIWYTVFDRHLYSPERKVFWWGPWPCPQWPGSGCGGPGRCWGWCHRWPAACFPGQTGPYWNQWRSQSSRPDSWTSLEHGHIGQLQKQKMEFLILFLQTEYHFNKADLLTIQEEPHDLYPPTIIECYWELWSLNFEINSSIQSNIVKKI